MRQDSDAYQDFEFPASRLRKFIAAGDIFTILLTNGEIIHHTHKDHDAFHQWLISHHIDDVKSTWN